MARRVRRAGNRVEIEAALTADDRARIAVQCRAWRVPLDRWHLVPEFGWWVSVAWTNAVHSLVHHEGETTEQAELIASERLGVSVDAMRKRAERRKSYAIVRAQSADKLSEVPHSKAA